MSEEEKQAIKTFEFFLDDISKNGGCTIDIDFQHKKEYEAMWKIFNLIEKQQEEIEHQIEKRNNQKEELAILNEKQKEFNNLTNTVKSYKGQFKRQQKELKKKDKIINKMSEQLTSPIHSKEWVIEYYTKEVEDK